MQEPIRHAAFSDLRLLALKTWGMCREKLEAGGNHAVQNLQQSFPSAPQYSVLGSHWQRKTYLAYALGMTAARQFFTVKNILLDFNIARCNGSIRKLMTQYKKYWLLIIDKWLLYPLKEADVRDLLPLERAK